MYDVRPLLLNSLPCMSPEDGMYLVVFIYECWTTGKGGAKQQMKAEKRVHEEELMASLPMANDVYFPFRIHISSAPLIHFRCTLISEPIYLYYFVLYNFLLCFCTGLYISIIIDCIKLTILIGCYEIYPINYYL